MQEMTTINASAKVTKEYGPLSTSPNVDCETNTSVGSRKKKFLKRAGAINYDEDESDEESSGGNTNTSAGTNFNK